MAPPRHMTSEDSFPPKTPGKVRLYNMQYCPYAMRAKLMLTRTGVDFEVININLKDKPAWFLEKFEAGTVPVFETDDKLLGESLVVAEYVDEVYSKPGQQLVPQDSYEKAKIRLLIADRFSKAITTVYKRLGKRDGWKPDFYKHVGYLEKLLGASTYFSGDKLGYADYMIWPWLRLINPYCINDVLQDFPNITRWLEDMSKDDTIIKCTTDPKILGKFIEAYAGGKPVYDLERTNA